MKRRKRRIGRREISETEKGTRLAEVEAGLGTELGTKMTLGNAPAAAAETKIDLGIAEIQEIETEKGTKKGTKTGHEIENLPRKCLLFSLHLL